MKGTVLLISVLIFYSNLLFGQNPMSQKKRTNIWYFGRNLNYTDGCAGLDFSSGTPVAIVGGKGVSIEGPSTICDTNGVHLFHSNNAIIYNANQDTMLNGDGIMSSNTTTQGTIEIPVPGSNNLYYLFATEGFGGNYGFSYSLIDMNGNAGFGEILPGQKNILLRHTSTEKIAAVHHCNGIDVWVLTNENGGNNYYSYFVNSNGLDTNPVVSALGEPDIIAGPGSLKFSPNGKLLVNVCQNYLTNPQLFQFDNSTGAVTNSITLLKEDSAEYSASFSPDSKKLYIATTNGRLIQYDVSLFDSISIINSRFVLRDIFADGIGLLQNGIDGKIYASKGYDTLRMIIHAPNQLGSFCNLDETPTIYLNGGTTSAGMGNFIESYFTDDSTAYPCNVGIDELEQNNIAVNLFPNPALYHLQLIVENSIQKPNIKIYDIQGKDLTASMPMENYEKLNSKQIYSFNCNNVPAGEYVITFQFPQMIISKKFLIYSKNKKK